MNPAFRSLFIGILCTVGAAYADPVSLSSRGLTVDVISATGERTIPVYIPTDKGSAASGRIIQPPANPMANRMGGASLHFMVKDEQKADLFHGFVLGDQKALEGKKLIVLVVQAKNESTGPQSFRVSDISCKVDGAASHLNAVGRGDSPPVTKFTDAELKAVSEVSFSIAPGETERVTYVFGADERANDLDCRFREGEWATVSVEAARP